MSGKTEIAIRPLAGAQRASDRFDRASIVLHWLTVLLIATQFATAWILSPSNPDIAVLAAHRSFGVFAWIIAAARLAWRNGFARLPPFPASMPRLQQWGAKLNEYALYAVLLVQPITGIAATLLRGRPFQLFAWTVPPLFAADDTRSHAFLAVHDAGASALLVLIGLHAAAALFHGAVLRDGVLQRMLPRMPR